MSVEAESCFNPNVKKLASSLVRRLEFAMNKTVFTRRVKRKRDIWKEYGIQEMLNKSVIFMAK